MSKEKIREEKLPTPKPEELKIIKEIGSLVGHKLEQVEKIKWNTRGYAVNEAGAVVELGFYESKITSNKLGKLTNKLSALTGLSYLDLSNNQLTDISPLAELTGLVQLSLHYNKLTDISPLAELKCLTQLFLGINKLNNVSALKELKCLTQLFLFNNQLTDISALRELTELTELDLSGNQLTDISELRGLYALKQLDLSGNQLTDISVLWGLSGLTHLDVRNNKLKSVPAELFSRDWEVKWEDGYVAEGINLHGNPLEEPPIEVVKQGTQAVRNYFDELEKGKKTLKEVKVILLGEGSAGKTSLVKRLVYDTYDKHEPQTHGIYLKDWEMEVGGEDIKIHFWDFGGQDIMKATHQFFYTHRSMYVLVLYGRPGENHERWLKQIDNYGGDSPIIVVINKIDVNAGFDVNRKFLCEKYKNIVGFCRLSCETKAGIDEFENMLREQLGRIEMINTDWPKSWVAAKEELKANDKDYIDIDDFRGICKGHKIEDEISQNVLLEQLHQLGVMLHFKDYGLKEKQVLNPVWVTGGAYKIITSKRLADNKGELKKEELSYVLNKERFEGDEYRKALPTVRYSAEEERYLVELMKKFELCYELHDKDAILVPDLLPVEETDIPFEYNTDAIQFYFSYNYLPDSTLPRFIVRMHEDIMDGLHWRTGVVLESKLFSSRAVIREDKEACKINIYVIGRQKSDYFATIRKTFYDINGEVKAEEWVPLPGEKGKAVSYKELIGHKMTGRSKYFNGELEKEYDVAKLLEGIVKPEDRLKKERSDGMGNINVGGNYYAGDVAGGDNVKGGKVCGDVVYGNKAVQEKVVNVGDGNVINAPIVIAEQIENSFNSIQDSKVGDELKELLSQLITEVNEAAKEVAAETAESMARDVETLSKEITSSKPRRRWYEMSVDGLREAAEAVGKVGEPILKTVAKLLPILNGKFGG